ncbi:MAG: hypothetical protein ACI9J5_003592 [Paraglaciecola sp.]|jgi:hypothetical protein
MAGIHKQITVVYIFLWLPSDPSVSQWRLCHSDFSPLNQGDLGLLQPSGFARFDDQKKTSSY